MGQDSYHESYDKTEIVEILSGCPRVNLDVPRGNSLIILALNSRKTKIVEILLRCSRVDLSCRDKEGWSLVFRAIQKKKLGEFR